MQPENTQSNGGLEQLPATPSGQQPERAPVLPGTETRPERQSSAERYEQRAEAQAAAADAAAQSQPVVPVAIPEPTTAVTDDPVATTNDHPVVAADEDLIEKEWVDKAKQIISETHDDPHERSKRINTLQKDYLQKRYGKELGKQSS